MGRRKDKSLLTFVVDTREQLAYQFAQPDKRFEDGGTLEYCLGEGDYGAELDGELLPVRIERKTIGDYYGICGNGRERFERELERLRAYRSFLVIEATADDVRRGYERSLIPGQAAWGSALSWAVRFGVMPIFAGHRCGGQQAAQKILESFAWHWLKGDGEYGADRGASELRSGSPLDSAVGAAETP